VPRSGAAGFSPARLRDARVQAGKSPAQLADAAGVPRPDLSKYEAGRASPPPPRLAALARALGTTGAALIEIPASGEGLAHIRAAAGLMQSQLASKSGIGLKRYQLAELGQRPLNDTDITGISSATAVSATRVRAAHARDIARFKARAAAAREQGRKGTKLDMP
jgi:transcriptional regulator with XRE-family HTH domain